MNAATAQREQRDAACVPAEEKTAGLRAGHPGD